MQKSKLISLFRTLSKDELKRFNDFVSSPYFNKNSNVIKLFNYLENYYPRYDSDKLNKEIVYDEIFPRRSYNIKIIKNLMSVFLRLVEEFIEHERYEKNPAGKYNYLLEELLNRKQHIIFRNKMEDAIALSEKLNIDEGLFYNNYMLYSLKHSFELRTLKGNEKLSPPEPIIDNIFSFFLMIYFKYNYNLLIRGLEYNFNPDLYLVEGLIDYINQREFKHKEILLIYYYIFMSNLKPAEDKYFNELRGLTKKYGMLLSRNELHNIYMGMQGYCIRKVSKGFESYKSINFEVSREMLSNNTYSESQSGIIHPLVFRYIAKAGAQVKEFEWTMNFIKEYREKLLPEFRENVYNYCHAYCFFKMGEYEKSLKYLSAVKYDNVYDKAEVNRLLMRIYYEMNWTEELLSLTDTYRHFLNNDKLISAKVKEVSFNFIQYVNTFYKIKKNRDRDSFDIKTKKEELENTDSYEKDWLFEKLNELVK
jgi:hypothetical protein